MSSISQIEVPGPDGHLHITSQQKVEQHLSEALHFQLTAHPPSWLTPFGLSWASWEPPLLLKISCMEPINAQQRLTSTHSN